MSKKLRLIAYDKKYLESYVSFAQRSWGSSSYQSKQEYLDWLYKKIPTGAAEHDFLIAVNESDQVVGSIHKMNLPWLVNSEKVIVPAIHNLLVEDKYRTGNGLFLITASLKGADNIFIPGVNPPLSDAYKMLKSQELNIKQYRQILRPIRGTLRYLYHKLFKSAPASSPAISNLSRMRAPIKYTFAPDKELIEKAVSAITDKGSHYQQKICWDSELFSWRFFDQDGPKHLMIYDDSNGAFDFIIISIGERKGLLVARIIEAVVSNNNSFKYLFQVMKSLLSFLQVDLLFAYSLENINDQLYRTVGLKPLKNQKTGSYIYHKNKNDIFSNLYLSVAAGDYGLESINIDQPKT